MPGATHHRDQIATGRHPRANSTNIICQQALKATLMYFKNNITEEVIAELLFVSHSVISETISTLEGVIVEALKDFEPDLAEAAEGLAGRVAVIDGSLHPCWSWKDKKDRGRASTRRPGT